ncbi:ribosomal protein S18 acetylase RimI-like enzyme [Bacillus ectoiniformans]|uniref:GNAT family N-acetyltransferase n=1 Tax=Bacillus ectoiniformans TaxID=1494429 RepID=UPI00195F046F|nr:GNAT family N-acetyltransferase [Bacillus ectoiniformans]MBM7647793.1 ribosomal protein S18 acetylase RimI-like enzyme [Bacillus ectoiniformans]
MPIEMKMISPGEDGDFLFQLYASSRQNEVLLWGWSEEMTGQFLKMQYMAQLRSYVMQYGDVDTKLIYCDGDRVGRLLLSSDENKLRILDITIHPEYQNKGIGTFILKEMMETACVNQQSVRLSVLNGNPAQRLYERLGFVVVEDGDIYCKMEWKDSQFEEVTRR